MGNTRIEKIPKWANAVLILQDGSIFFGVGVGSEGIATGEICFNTSMTGYQEIITDPSYFNQIITFTFPHIGNVGANNIDIESDEIFASGVVLNNIPTMPANWRSKISFSDWLKENSKMAISKIDTRALTSHLRKHGAQKAIICFSKNKENFDIEKLKEKLNSAPEMQNLDLAKSVCCKQPYSWGEANWDIKNDDYKDIKISNDAPHIVLLDFGVKKNILRELAKYGTKITVVPATSTVNEILKISPDGILLSNGPGDPSATAVYAAPVVKELLEQNIPIFGICLGHQILAISLGMKTKKMLFGHRGANHPVTNKLTDKVEITSQNHGFCVVLDNNNLNNIDEFSKSLFDSSNEGILLTENENIFSVQYHPEASPGPHDSNYLFKDFLEKVKKCKKQKLVA